MTTYKCSSCRTVLTPIMYSKKAILICKLCGKQHQYPKEDAIIRNLEPVMKLVELLESQETAAIFFPLGAIGSKKLTESIIEDPEPIYEWAREVIKGME